jgi:hypothetical protein
MSFCLPGFDHRDLLLGAIVFAALAAAHAAARGTAVGANVDGDFPNELLPEAETSLIREPSQVGNPHFASLQFEAPSLLVDRPLTDVAVLNAVTGNESGEDVLYYTTTGEPALFHVVSLRDYGLKATYPLPGVDLSWGHTVAPDGSVYIAGVGSGASGRLYRYHPAFQDVDDLGVPVPNHKFIWRVIADSQGNIYGGTWEGGHVFRYDPSADSFHDFGRIDPGEDYVRSIAWHGGYVYAGTGVKNGRVWRLDPGTGARERIEIPLRPEYQDRYGAMGSVSDLVVAGDHLFVKFGSVGLAYDLVARDWWSQTYTGLSGPLLGLAGYDNESFFLHTGSGVRRIDLQTRSSSIVSPGANFRGGGWIFPPCYHGAVYATVNYGGSVTLIDPFRSFTRSLPSVAVPQTIPLQSIGAGPDGMIYVSGYMGVRGAQIDQEMGNTINFSLGQAEGLTFMNDRIYWGVYSGAHVFSNPLSNPHELVEEFKISDQQDRPFALIPGGGRLIIGTVPASGQLGGALTIFDPSASGAGRVRTYRNVVPNQSVVGVAYRDGFAYGSTSIHGGLGVSPSESRAKVFKWDIAGETLVVSRDLSLSGIGQQTFIGGLSTGPDGLIYGIVNGTVFALAPETLDVVRYRNIYPDVGGGGRWRPRYLWWDSDGILYANPGGRITAIDPVTFEYRSAGVSSALMALGTNTAVYYVSDDRVMRMNVAK